MHSFDHAVGRIQQWSHERKLLQNGTPEGQAKKTREESQEFLDAETHRARVDALGDMGVSWVNTCLTYGECPVDVLYEAIDQIKGRTGHMGADGIFHKDS